MRFKDLPIQFIFIFICIIFFFHSCSPSKSSSSEDYLSPLLAGNITNVNQTTNSSSNVFSINSISPNDGATDVGILPTIQMYFSSSLDTSTIRTTSTLGECSGNIHFGQIGLSTCLPIEIISNTGISGELRLKPLEPLAYGTTYELYLKNKIKDSAGNFLSSEKRIKFRTTEINSISPTYTLDTTSIKAGIDSPLTFSIYPNSDTKSVRSVTVTFAASPGPRPKYNGLNDYSIDYPVVRLGERRQFILNPGGFTPSLIDTATYQPGMTWGFGISAIFHDGSRSSVGINVPVVKNLPNVTGSIYTIKLMGFTDDWVPAANEYQSIGDWKIWLRIRYPDSGIVFETQKQSLAYSTHVLIRPTPGDTREEITIYFDSDGDDVPNYQKVIPSSISFTQGTYGDLSQFYVFYGEVINGNMNLIVE
ncbi:MAG: Ig-like domain-containing protein [Leptospira sp.]|nr:Ig-like domain-containing protein [Leptospira sp.]